MAVTDMEVDRSVEAGSPIPRTDYKRGHNEISQDNGQVDSSHSTPPKRTKRSNISELNGRGVLDEGEGRNDVQVIAPSDSENANQDGVSGSIHLVEEIGAAPSMNWNVGTKAKIRTTLGGGLRTDNGHEKQQQEKAKTLSKIQSSEIKKTKRRLEVLHKRLSGFEDDNPKFKKLQNRIHESEVDYNYCQFYPVDEDYESLLYQRQADVAEHENEDESGGRGGGKRRESKPPLWQLVEQCMNAGNLEALKAGKVHEGSLMDDLRSSILQKDVEPTTPPEIAIEHELSRSETSRHVGTLKVYGSGPRTATVDPSSSEPRALDICKAMDNGKLPKMENRIFTVKLSPQLQNRPEGQERESDRNPEPHFGYKSDQDPELRQDQDSGSDGGVILNLQTSEQESGEVSESNSHAPDNHEEDNIIAHDPKGNGISEDDEDEDGDAMMEYARSDAVAKGLEGNEDNQGSIITPKLQPRTIVELNPEDLKAQLRYFHITQRPDNIDHNTLVRCLICAQEGHMAEVCVGFTCITCGIHSDHLSQHCPQKKGYLNRRPGEIVCDLCQRNGHYEEDCELIWRTSGRPWESDLTNKGVRLSCYECGKSGHLGNDCTNRRPGKSVGTSTWSLNSNGQFTIKSQGEVTIKGRAQQQKPIMIDDSDDDQANFYRPRVPEPARKGQIRILTGTNQKFDDRQSDTYASGVRPYRNGGIANSRSGGYWDSRNEPGQNRYRPGDRRSSSPRYSEPYPSQSNSDMNMFPRQLLQRPSPRGGGGRRRNGAGGGHYRPMPSAAQNAWSKHRDYCDVYLTHDSMSVRKAHNSGRNHERNVLDYYQQIGHEKAQSVIDSITSSYAAEGQAGSNPMLNQGGGPIGGPGFPPPFGFPGGMPPPPFGMPGAPPPGGPGGFPPPPFAGRGMPFPPFPPNVGPGGPPPMGMPGMPFPPPGGMPPNFQMPPQGGFPPHGSPPQQGGPFPPPGGMGGGQGFGGNFPGERR